MKTELKDLVIGRKYKLKPLKWFKSKSEKATRYEFYKLRIGEKYAGKTLILTEVVNGDELVLRVSHNYSDGEVWVKKEGVSEIKGQPNPSKEIVNLIKKLKKENYIYGYTGGPGAGGGGTINTNEELILPAFDKDGNENIYLKVDAAKRLFTIDEIKKLFKNGLVEKRFEATEFTTITTQLKLIKNKKNLPKYESWITMRD